ncbi:MAG: ATP-binding protein [Actinomycetota bacterium]
MGRRPRTPVGRLLLWQLGAVLLILSILGVELYGLLAEDAPHLAQPARSALIVSLAGAGALLTAVALILTVRLSRTLRHMQQALSRFAEGDPTARVEQAGPEELHVLAETLNRLTERLSKEIESSREAQRTRDLILTSMEEGVLLIGPEGTVGFANRASERHLGFRPDSASKLTPAALQEAVKSAVGTDVVTEVEVETGSPPRSLRATAIPVGHDGSVLLVVRDVTEAKRLESVRRDFVANASHELKTPAATIQAAAETIRQAVHDDPDVVPRFAEQLEHEAKRLSRIVSDLLDLSRLESGSELAETISLSDLVREESERAAPVAAARDVQLSLESQAVSVRGSERDLGLLVHNLVDNAIRYTRPGGSVRVALGEQDGSAVLVVRDTGIGIPARDLPRVFERFYRVDRARSRETGGTGLGLSIVKHVAENHGGSVSVESELGGGSVFEVRLPADGDGRGR